MPPETASRPKLFKGADNPSCHARATRSSASGPRGRIRPPSGSASRRSGNDWRSSSRGTTIPGTPLVNQQRSGAPSSRRPRRRRGETTQDDVFVEEEAGQPLLNARRRRRKAKKPAAGCFSRRRRRRLRKKAAKTPGRVPDDDAAVVAQGEAREAAAQEWEVKRRARGLAVGAPGNAVTARRRARPTRARRFRRDGVLELREPLGQLARRREERGVDVVSERLDILDADLCTRGDPRSAVISLSGDVVLLGRRRRLLARRDRQPRGP